MRYLPALILVCFFCHASKAQHDVTSAGGDAAGAGGSIAFSIGQILYTVQTNVNGTVHQGVEIVYETADAGVGVPGSSGCLCVYPIPTEDNVVLEVPAFLDQNYSFKLYSSLGVLLASENVSQIKTLIYTDVLPGSAYLLQVFQNGEKIKTFKVLKK